MKRFFQALLLIEPFAAVFAYPRSGVYEKTYVITTIVTIVITIVFLCMEIENERKG